MKNLVVLMICVTFIIGMGRVSGQAYNGNGDQKVQVGFSPYGNGTGISGTYDYGINNIFSVGGGAEFYVDNEEDNENFYIFGRVDAHLGELIGLPSNMDLYPGIDLGILGDNLGLGGHIGYRYFITDRMGAFIEAGSRGSLGISFNL